MVPEMGRSLRPLTFALLALATLAVQLAVHDVRPFLENVAHAAFWVVLTIAASFVVPRPRDPRDALSPIAYVVIVALVALPFALEPIRRRIFHTGDPIEIQMVGSLRNLALAMAACSARTICLRLATISSLFLVLFAAIMTDHPLVVLLLGTFAAIGSLWLTTWYWSGLHPNSRDCLVANRAATTRHSIPWVATGVAIGFVAFASGMAALGPKRVIATLGEWVPSSGGTGNFDPFARGGVNDGDDETRGKNANSTGMVPSGYFLESPLPSLYDAINEFYGDPYKANNRESTIALSPKEMIRESEKSPTDNLRPNREHAMRRDSPSRPRHGTDRDARAIFEVQGRTPLYLRAVAYDRYVNDCWAEAPFVGDFPRIEKASDSNWMELAGRMVRPIFSENDFHSIKLTAPTGSLVPTPPHLVRFRIGHVNLASFFSWSQDRILRFATRKAPSGIVVETESRSIDPVALSSLEMPNHQRRSHPQYFIKPTASEETLAAIAREWTKDRPRGWPQVEAIIERLRTEYAFDPTAVRSKSGDPVLHFLLESKRGADDQFATAAALLLRSLDYPSRLASGYYVSPERFDIESGHSPVLHEDVHFWVETLLPWDDWVVLEPTPGYQLPGPNRSWTARALAGLDSAWDWLQTHSIPLGLTTLALAGAVWFRREIVDAVVTTSVRLSPGKGWRTRVARTMSALELRGRFCGLPRRIEQSRSRWTRAVTASCPDDPLVKLGVMSEWAVYAPTLDPPWTESDVAVVCRRALDEWRLARWTAVARHSANRGLAP